MSKPVKIKKTNLKKYKLDATIPDREVDLNKNEPSNWNSNNGIDYVPTQNAQTSAWHASQNQTRNQPATPSDSYFQRLMQDPISNAPSVILSAAFDPMGVAKNAMQGLGSLAPALQPNPSQDSMSGIEFDRRNWTAPNGNGGLAVRRYEDVPVQRVAAPSTYQENIDGQNYTFFKTPEQQAQDDRLAKAKEEELHRARYLAEIEKYKNEFRKYKDITPAWELEAARRNEEAARNARPLPLTGDKNIPQ